MTLRTLRLAAHHQLPGGGAGAFLRGNGLGLDRLGGPVGVEGVCSFGRLAVGIVTLGRRDCVEDDVDVVRAGGGREAPFCPAPAHARLASSQYCGTDNPQGDHVAGQVSGPRTIYCLILTASSLADSGIV